MKIYTAKNIKPCKETRVDADIPVFGMPTKTKFVTKLMIDDIVANPIFNTLLLLFIIFGAVVSLSSGTPRSIIIALTAVLILKFRAALTYVTLYDSFHGNKFFNTLTDRGINTMLESGNKLRYVRMETNPWENIDKVICYSDLVSLRIKRKHRNQSAFHTAYLWSDDVPLLMQQIQHLWYNALYEEKPPLRLYSPKEYDEVTNIITEKYGKYESVLHEILPSDIHIDIAKIPPQGDNDHYTLCTIGAGDYNMHIGGDSSNKTFIEYRVQFPEQLEYMIILPSDWPLDEESLKKEENYWPIRLLKQMARFPLITNDWVCEGHTAEFEEDTRFSPLLPYSCVTFSPPSSNISDGVNIANLSTGKSLGFVQIVPITREELNLIRSEDRMWEFFERISHDAENVDSKLVCDRLRPKK